MSDAWPTRVTIGDFIADNDTGADFRVTAKLTGWESSPPVRLTLEDRAQQDGAWDATPLLASRPIVIQGEIDQANHAAAMAVADALTGLRVQAVHQLIVDNDAVGERTAWVRIEAGAELDWVTPESFSYTLGVRAPDPLKYGVEQFEQATLAGSAGGVGLTYPLTYPLDYGVAPGVTPGALSLSNRGTASYFPRLRIDGPVVNPVITLVETGDRIAVALTLIAGQWLDIDCSRRRVLLNGQVPMRHVTSATGNWCAVPVGGASLTWTADSADPAARLSAWSYEGAWT